MIVPWIFGLQSGGYGENILDTITTSNLMGQW